MNYIDKWIKDNFVVSWFTMLLTTIGTVLLVGGAILFITLVSDFLILFGLIIAWTFLVILVVLGCCFIKVWYENESNKVAERVSRELPKVKREQQRPDTNVLAEGSTRVSEPSNNR